ncbi:DUF1643 domain-containing protein [Cellulosilyticum ruminicola]|uniref:DUF1643 domain-containing protein n=1 Tax=Cellulosilyticum ruminicola TaxID=425254 RepID=UPI0006CFA8A6|nr:DUF1643 domain-containing protein [Cellulosilyticum ruminicola]
MEIEKSTITTEVHYSEDRHHRYLLYKEWDNSLKKATIIMLNPAIANAVTMDLTTMYIINNISKLGYGSVEIVNIFSKLNAEINSDIKIELLTDETNDKMIRASVARTDTVIIAVGKGGETNKQIKTRVEQLMELIKEHENKLYEICDEKGRYGWHPLAPSVRSGWKLLKMGKPKEQNKVVTKQPKKTGKESE